MMDINTLQKEAAQELEAIVMYWMQHTLDTEQGGFVGRIDGMNIVHADAPKGAVLNSRILWTFSAAYRLTNRAEYLQISDRAYQYIVECFIDREYGGVYWTVDCKGNPLDTKKQIYAIAFALYGISEYVRATNSEAARQHALQLYNSIETYSHDTEKGGYIEALTREWKDIADLRLSAKDANERKTMNTHLHVLEAYANLYGVWPDAVLKKNIAALIHLFLDHIIDAETNHLVLFFDDDWQPRSQTISFGHDIEAAWLVQEATEIIGDEDLVAIVKQRSIKITEAAMQGLDSDGGLWYEQEGSHWIKEKHWWPQAEALVGFFNAWQLTGDDNFLKTAYRTWDFIQSKMLDKQAGEWFWGITEDGAVMLTEDKAGLWKCPYHNARACMEIIKRIDVNSVI